MSLIWIGRQVTGPLVDRPAPNDPSLEARVGNEAVFTDSATGKQYITNGQVWIDVQAVGTSLPGVTSDGSGGVVLAGGLSNRIITVNDTNSSDYGLGLSDGTVVVDSSNMIISLPDIASVPTGRVFRIVNSPNASNTTVNTNTPNDTWSFPLGGPDMSIEAQSNGGAYAVLTRNDVSRDNLGNSYFSQGIVVGVSNHLFGPDGGLLAKLLQLMDDAGNFTGFQITALGEAALHNLILDGGLALWGQTGTLTAQPVLPAGAGKTVDDVISLLQSYGLAKQS